MKFFSTKPTSTKTAPRMAKIPRLILWAWERPEDLSFIDPQNIGVAFLAKTILLRDQELIVKPRFQPLTTHPGTALIAVVRVETDRKQRPTLSVDQRAKLVTEISKLFTKTNLAGIQIDFDATKSERAFYRDLLVDLRRQLPANLPLSITALASWAYYDDWISDLPVDEAVPMLFRLGVDQEQITSYIRSGKEFQPIICRDSLGISLDEPLSGLPAGRRIYVFNPNPWNAATVENIVEKINRL